MKIASPIIHYVVRKKKEKTTQLANSRKASPAGGSISKITGHLFGPFSPAGRGKRAGSPEEVAPSGRHGLDLQKGCWKGEALLKLFWKGQRPSEALLEGFKS